MMRNPYVRSAMLSLMVLFAGALTLFAQQRWGVAIDPKAPKVTLTEIVAKPDLYAGKTVLVDGTFAGDCGDGDFFFKDKFEIIEATPPDPNVCLLKKFTKVRLYGLVKVRRSKPAKPGEAGEAHVRIDAKAVEILK